MLRQRSLTALGTVAVALGLVLGAAAPAAAHNYVVSSTPEDGATITAAPESFTITTNDVLLDLSGDGAGFGMVISDEAGQYYGDGCVTIDGRSMSTVAALGPAGNYTLAFQLISADGHTLSESLKFTYEPAAGEPAATGSSTMPNCGGAADASAAGGEASGAPSAEAEANAIVLTVAIVGGLIAVGIVTLVAVSGRRARAASDAGDAADAEATATADGATDTA